MKSIGFSNFRRFHNFPEIELGDITFLVGGNNSGKSTLVKALLMCAENLVTMVNVNHNSKNIFSRPQFNFDSKFYNGIKVKSFARAVTNNVAPGEKFPSDIMSFSFSYSGFDFFIFIEGDCDKDLATADIVYVSILDTVNDRFFEVHFGNGTMSFSLCQDNVRVLKQISDLLSQSRLESEKLKAATQAEVINMEEIAEINNRIAFLTSKLEALCEGNNEFLEELLSKIEEKEFTNQEEYNDFITNFLINNSKDFSDGLLTVPLRLFLSESDVNLFEDVVNNFIQFADSGKEPPKETGERREEEDGEFEQIVPDKQEQDKTENEEQQSDEDVLIQILKQDMSVIRRSQEALNKLIWEVKSAMPIYITAHSATQNALYNTADANDYNAIIVHEYFNSKIFAGDPEYNFVIDWMKRLGIGASFEIIPIAGEAFKIIIKDGNGAETLLADKGMGSIQLMILLLRLATIIRKSGIGSHKPTIIIEEPEQNLHPAMQSKLAELFLHLNKKFGFKFIVETHSEYLIRKTQVLVAQENYKDEKDLTENNPFKVYYFNSEEGEQPCYEMEYSISGAFKNKFGAGFFDEAAESDMVIIRKEHELKKRRR